MSRFEFPNTRKKKYGLKIEPTEIHLLELVQAERELVYFMLLLANLN